MTIPPHSLAVIRQPAFILDAAARVLAANDLAEAMVGRPLVGLSAQEAAVLFACRRKDGTPLAPAELPSYRALAGDEVVEEPILVTGANGESLHVLATTTPMREGDAIIGARVIWQDITGRVRATEALEESERRHAFLLTLGDRLRELGDTSAIAAAAAEMVGRHLGANGVAFCEVDATGGQVTVLADWTDGTLPPAAGRHRLDHGGAGDDYLAGRAHQTADVAAILAGDGGDRGSASPLRAHLEVPIRRGGRLASVLSVRSGTPRRWTDAEIALVREAGDRALASVQRSRAEAALGESEERLRQVLGLSSDAVYRTDLRAGRFDYISPANEAQTGFPAEEFAAFGLEAFIARIHVEDQPRIRAIIAEAMRGS